MCMCLPLKTTILLPQNKGPKVRNDFLFIFNMDSQQGLLNDLFPNPPHSF